MFLLSLLKELNKLLMRRALSKPVLLILPVYDPVLSTARAGAQPLLQKWTPGVTGGTWWFFSSLTQVF